MITLVTIDSADTVAIHVGGRLVRLIPRDNPAHARTLACMRGFTRLPALESGGVAVYVRILTA